MDSLLRSSLLIPDHQIPSISRTDREVIKRAIALLKWSVFAAYMVSAEANPQFTSLWGFQSTKKGSLGSPVGLDSVSEAAKAFDRMSFAKLFLYLLGSH